MSFINYNSDISFFYKATNSNSIIFKLLMFSMSIVNINWIKVELLYLSSNIVKMCEFL
jgi:hypothetical protein